MKECDKWNHDEMAAAVLVDPAFDERRQAVRETCRMCRETADAGEHPEWHCYEMHLSDVQWEAKELLIKKGALRYGTYQPQTGKPIMEFEGLGDAVAELKGIASAKALKAGYKPVFTVQAGTAG
jgi:hypothetical protein